MVAHSEARNRTAHVAATLVAVAAFIGPARSAGAQRLTLEQRSWSASSLQLAGAFAVALWIDAAQTREAVRRQYVELNPVLGPHPSIGRVNTYTAVAGLTVLGAAAALPARVRPWLLGAALAVETFAIAGNMRAGLAMKFP